MLYDQYLADGAHARHGAIWVQLGNMRKEAGHPEMALAAYETALQIDPAQADTHLQMGHLAKIMGDLDRAELCYAEAVRLQPGPGNAANELAALRQRRSSGQVSGPVAGVPELPAAAGITAEPLSGPVGYVDEIKGDAIQGWVMPPRDAMAGTLSIVVTCAGQEVGRIKADRYRPDVARHTQRSPYCGFLFKVPARFRTGRPVTFTFRTEPGGAELQGSPFHYASTSGAAQAQLAALNNAIEEMSTQLWRMRRDLRQLLATEVTTLDDYDGWARRYQDALRFRRGKAAPLPRTPLVSVICPVYRPRLPDFRAAVQSVLDQTYPNWELILVDDNSRDPELTRVIEGFCADSRVRALSQAVNGGISTATNAAIAAARGEYVALFDHDDMLLDVALDVMVDASLRTGAKVLYSDEDKIDDFGRFSEPNLKPDWNYRLLLGQNYVCHFLMVETGALRAAGPLDRAYDGAQDHDLVLRLSETVPAARIHHVPEVIYHWRKTPGSTASEIGNKSYAVESGASAVRDHLHRRDKNVAVWPMLGVTTYSIDWRFTDEPSVCIVIPYREKVELTRRCVEAVRNNTHYRNYETVLVDNWSTSAEAVAFRAEAARWGRTRVMLVEEPFNYSRLNNLACAGTKAEFVLFMNNDVFVEQKDWLRRLVDEALADDEVAAVGAKLVYPDRTIQHGGVILGVGGIADHAYRGRSEGDPFFQGRGICAQELSCVTAALMLCRHAAFDAVRGFDEAGLSVAYNDVDLCLKLRQAGWRIIYVPGVVAEHHESISRGDDMDGANFSRFVMEEQTMAERWKTELASDPFYNPNFSRSGGIFEELSSTKLAFYDKG